MIAWAIEAVIASTALMLLVMLVRRPVAAHFGAQTAYALWALPALRMILPPIALGFGAQAPMSAVEPVSGSISDMVRDSVLAGSVPMQATPALEAANSLASPGWIAAAVLVWLAGAALFLIGHFWGYRRFRAHLLSGAETMGDVAPGVALFASPRASGPMAFGLRHRLIVFPVDAAERFDSDEHALALAHELAHHRRGDLIANAFALGVVALHWWNPVAWAAYRLFRADQEVACDAQVVAEARQRGLGQAYGRALIKAATNREFAIACHLTSVDTLKRRLAMLAKTAPSGRRRRLGLMLIGGTTLAGLALTASGQGVAADVSSKVARALPTHAVGSVLSSTLAPVEAVRSVEVPQSVILPAAVPAPPALPVALAAVPEALDIAEAAPPAPPATPRRPAVPAPSQSAAPPFPGAIQVRFEVDQARLHARIAERQAERAAEQAERIRERELARAERTRERAQADAERAQADAERAQLRDEFARGPAERDTQRAAIRAGRAHAIAGISEARRGIVNNDAISQDIRTKILSDLDRQIARLRAGQD